MPEPLNARERKLLLLLRRVLASNMTANRTIAAVVSYGDHDDLLLTLAENAEANATVMEEVGVELQEVFYDPDKSKGKN